MDQLLRSIGDAISNLFATTFHAVGDALRGAVDAANRALPGGLLAVVVFILLVVGAWALAKR
ncbi:MAG TPA: hypothetical protein VH720_11545 [Candidatus Limnocylindrales bacterium]